MVTTGRAICIVFSDNDLPPDGPNHTRPLYILVSCSGRQVSSVLLDNGSALNVCPLTTAITLGYAPYDLGPSLRQFELMIALGERAKVIPSSLHQKVKFIHDGQIVIVQSHGGARYDEGMSYFPGMGLERRQHGPSEFMTIPDHDVPFGLGFIPTKADYRYMARLCKERVRARLTHTPFDYPIRPYTMSLKNYFVRVSKPHTYSDGIIERLSTTQEVELQHLVH
ncbi:hypothetical protein CK203_035720 [Vitis vinifera]|uniref:Uncharacterized protein n=1 Tax=Vitis vinifera TaxID=29760 RepID=A0A438ICQ0_VITVI|nr:hypothetical protein CK203_035720 [Vitis vinifera]